MSAFTAHAIPHGAAMTPGPQLRAAAASRITAAATAVAAALLAGCEGRQSALAPAGREAAELATLFWWMLGGAVVLWLFMNGLFLYVTRLNPKPLSRRAAESIVIGGGVLFPTVVLGALLTYSLDLMPRQRAEGEAGLSLDVSGERFWWRVAYLPEGDGDPIVAANEIRLPVGRRTEIALSSDDVIHSFWLPALAGKVDMFPGRDTRIALEPTETGTFRGQCAEFCGASHALMGFEAVVMEPDDFDAWLAHQRSDAVAPANAKAGRGRDVFLSEGCGACHSIRGTPAAGRFGPDLTHVGGRESLGAGILPVAPDAFAEWIAHTDLVKPEVDMPSYEHLDAASLAALATYLDSLK